MQRVLDAFIDERVITHVNSIYTKKVHIKKIIIWIFVLNCLQATIE